ncbi:SCO family protein [Erythrobacter sp. SD-21]|uniref:SCO family protein n=1 Tax=Erythrobacter sp. SD-21 TaxID=161528 RepID=UPI000154088D|nr:SCO family protein [Erythrobacter sp. SD-21]EDL47728.1 SCO1/SenC family protein [Erythrobacter sp. SD-21]
MRHSPIRISDSYVVSEEERDALEQSSTLFGSAQVSPDEMGGWFDYTDWRDRKIDRSYFLGRWTMLYFGYARCQGSCREAAPMLARAASELRDSGYAARAAFVDIEVHPVAPPQPIRLAPEEHAHSYNWAMRMAQSDLYERHAGQLDVLSGNRAQLAQATMAFHVLREHTTPHRGEKTMSINHSSMVYLLGRDTFVAAYGYHDMGADALVSLVRELAAAERKTVDFAAAKKRYLRGACGGDV